MVLVSKGDFIWLEPAAGDTTSASIGARVLDHDRGRLKVVDDTGTEQWLSADRRVRLMHASSVQGVSDMCQLSDYHESAVLRNILVRYSNKLIYTYTGSILIAVNPYVDIPIYTAEQIRQYKQKKIGELPPHIFAIADNAYSNMRRNKRNQSIVISGNTGSGKTESTKLTLQFLATISGQHSWIEQQVLEANPILEAFGNAKTTKNDNSSRFGKYIEVHFNERGSIEGARIEQYLLEKCRITQHEQNERNYHIFYCLLAGLGAEEKRELELTNAGDYFYLNQGKSLLAEGRDDAADLAEVRSAMKVLMFKEAEISSIFKVLAGLLHIGNVRYRGTTIDNVEAVDVSDAANIVRISRLLQLDEQSVLDALTTKTLVTRDERVVRRFTAEQAVQTRDALAKGIYQRLFSYLVTRINEAICKPRSSKHRSSIGVLDIFGFEQLEKNSFEQLCINLANEHLQQFFLQHVFKMEQEEYDKEHINWHKIQFNDNQKTLDLLSVKQMNIFSLIDEESIFPKGTDQTMLNKLHAAHSRNESYLRPKSDVQRAFGIVHFAGPVYYHTRGFLEKNRDAFSSDLFSLVTSSKMHFLNRLFDDDAYRETKRKGFTLASQFRRSLEQLMLQLSNTEPFFVRCIKPNDFKRALMIERELVLRQLRFSGMMETIKIRCSGYPVRHSYEEFVARYRVLINGIGAAHKVDCHAATKKICAKVLGPNADYQLGRTKVFLKDRHDLFLEQEFHRMLNERALTIQRWIRGYIVRKEFERQRAAAVTIQKTWRAHREKIRYRQILAGFSRLQAVLRSRMLVQHYQSLRSAVIHFQATCRGSLLRAQLREMRRLGQEKATIVPVEEEVVQPEAEVKDDEIMQLFEAGGPQVDNLFDFLPVDNRLDSSVESDSTESSRRESVSKSPPQAAEPTFSDEDLTKYQFPKFAATFFQGQATATHSKKPLKVPLLAHSDPSTQLAAMAVWTTILRFMGDLPDAKPQSPSITNSSYDKTPVMSRLYATLGRSYSQRDVDEASLASEYDMTTGGTKTLKKGMGKKLISMTLKKKSKLTGMTSNASSDSLTSTSNALLDNSALSSLDKLHYIIGLGILKAELRDEIYCQLCKQLSSNPSKLSAARGWILLSLCVGCFTPSEKFMNYLTCFIRERGPTGAGYSQYVEDRLRRTTVNGTRHQPPSYVELQANKSKKPIVLAVTFMDGSVKTICADSASTSAELCEQLAKKVSLTEKFGFSLYIALFDKVSSLGAGNDHVMDAISQCETYAKEQGKQERNAPWRLFFRKEIFSPWHDPKQDPISTNLIYQQLVRGIRYGEYRCDKSDDLAAIASQQYYIDEGSMDVARLDVQLNNYVPEFEFTAKQMARERWTQAIMHQYRKRFGTNKPTVLSVKEEIVAFAKFKWPLLFSRFYEALKFAGPPLPKNEVIIAVNWTGIYVVDDQEQVLLEFSFPEIIGVVYAKGKRVGADMCTVRAVSGEEYTFQSPNSEDICQLVTFFLDGLKHRSTFLIATQAQRGDDQFLEFERGDLLTMLGSNGEQLAEKSVVKAVNERTTLIGLVRSEHVYVIPTITKPTANVLKVFPKDVDLSLDVINNNNRQVAIIDENDPPYTLQLFAEEHFANGARKSQLSLATLRRRQNDSGERWRFSRDAIATPLLKKLDSREEASREAVESYLFIMKYMGDQPSRRSRLGTHLTDHVFKSAIQVEILRDELYCQLMKQLTGNPSMLSEERGWELLWLAAGLFAPSQSLMKEVNSFLRSRHHPVAVDCQQRLMRIAKNGSRKYPPHLVEVEAIQHKTTQIFHKVYFPDQTDEAIEVDSATKARDFCQKIARRLGLKSAEGFSLFVKIKDKVLAVPETEFFFDFVRQLSDWVQNNHAHKESPIIPINYQVFFMRKLWMNVVPAADVNADVIFHYYQECPKYLLGYHKCSKHDAIELAAFILRAITKENKNPPLAQIPQLLNELVPKDMTKLLSSNDWKKYISAAFIKVEHLSSDQAKIEFLKYIALWPTFGSAFFLASQYSDISLPEKLLVAINQSGVNIYNSETKNLLVQYPFNSICNWTSGNTYFNMSVGNVLKGNEGKKLLLDTTMGYKMDDLITSYISLLISGQTRPQQS